MSEPESRYRIGVDVGGTFTDLVAIDDGGRITTAKSASTPEDQSTGVLAGLELLAGSLGIERAALLAVTDRIVHGTTVATNALLERKGAKVGLLTTEGHRDVLEMREGLKDDRYALRQPAPEPLVPRHLRLPVRERIRADGGVGTPIDEGSLRSAIGALADAQVEAIAVCYLHAYRNAEHERVTGEALAREMPAAYVCLSSEVFPQIKEFERVCTTVVNAYVGPVLERYLRRLERRLAEAGYAGPVLIMQSHGGLAIIADAVRLAAGGVLSGPAGGVAAARHASRILEHANLIAFDMGGTSTDMSLVVDGEAAVATDRRVAGHRVALHSLDIASIGAGGGSIAHVDAGGVLHVGPGSAGADPGPACYGRGGTSPTVTDANLVLGYLDPPAFPGGPATARCAGCSPRGRHDLGAARHRPHGRRGRGSPHRQHPHGGRDSARVRPSRRRPAPLCPALVRGSRRCPRDRRRAGARTFARGGAEARPGVLGMGHARERPAIRDRAYPRRRCERARRA